MKIKRKLYSKLPDSRIGIGWIQEGNGKVKSEKYLNSAQKAASKSFEIHGDSEKAIKDSKSAVTKEVLLDEAPEIVGKSALVGAVGYGTAKYLDKAEKLVRSTGARINGVDISTLPKIPEKILKVSKGNAGKIAAGLTAGTIAYQTHKKKLSKKIKSARTGAEINTEDRVKNIKNIMIS